MQEVIIMRGIPGSGKTTYAKSLKYKRINRDDLRMMIDDSVYSKQNEYVIVQARNAPLRCFLSNNESVVIDDTNLNGKNIIDIMHIVHNEFPSVNIKIHTIDVDIKTAIERDANRDRTVGINVIRDSYDKFMKNDIPNISNTLSPIEYKEDPLLPNCIIVDIDGTIAHKTDRGFFDWMKVGTDTPDKNIIEIVTKFKDTHNIIFLSGRDEICYDITKDWIQTHTGIKDFKLYMRPLNDMRKDYIVKYELFIKHLYKKYNVSLVLDDRDQVVHMWRKYLNLKTLQVEYGNF